MCRIAIVPSELKSEKYIKTLFDFLEDAMGGDGNGFAYFNSKPGVQISKALDLKTEHVAELNTNDAMILFHTRKTSAGTHSNLNVQPFEIFNKDAALCHNGTWSKYDDFKAALFCQGKLTVDEYKDLSDTHVLSKLMDIPEVAYKALGLPESGVFVVHKKEYSEVYVKSGDFEAYKTKSGKFIYASEFPRGYDYTYKFKSGTIIRAYKDHFKILKGGVTYEKNVPSSYTVYGSHWTSPC